MRSVQYSSPKEIQGYPLILSMVLRRTLALLRGYPGTVLRI